MNPLLTDSRRQALRSASHWYAVLSGERVSPQQEARWQQWYEQDQDNLHRGRSPVTPERSRSSYRMHRQWWCNFAR